MSFFKRNGWVYQFLEADLKATIGRIRTCTIADVLRDLLERTPTKFDLGGKQAVQYGFSIGRGAVDLKLTQEQYRKMRRLGDCLTVWCGAQLSCLGSLAMLHSVNGRNDEFNSCICRAISTKYKICLIPYRQGLPSRLRGTRASWVFETP